MVFNFFNSLIGRILAASLCVAVVFSITFAPFEHTHVAEAASLINYQGKLMTSSSVAVPDGLYNIEFKLYTASSGGSAIWTETHTGADKIQLTSGLFSTLLGQVSSLSGIDFDQPLYLGVNIGGTGSPSWDGEMSPRKQFASVPSAFVADKAKSLDGTNATSTNFVATNATTTNLVATNAIVGDSTTTNAAITNANIATANVSALTVSSLNGLLFGTNGAVSAVSTSSLNINTDNLVQGTTNKFYSDTLARGAVSSSAAGLTYTSGTGVFSLTSGYVIPLVASTTAWEAKVSSQWATSGSDIYYSTGNVGIHEATPQTWLHIGDTLSDVSSTFMTDPTVLIVGKDGATTGSMYEPILTMARAGISGSVYPVTASFDLGNQSGSSAGGASRLLLKLSEGPTKYTAMAWNVSSGVVHTEYFGQQNMSALGDGVPQLTINDTSSANTSGGKISFFASGASVGSVGGMYDAGSLSLLLSGGNHTEDMRIVGSGANSGNVGIGTTTPTSKLTVAGNASFASGNTLINSDGGIDIGTSSPANLSVNGIANFADSNFSSVPISFSINSDSSGNILDVNDQYDGFHTFTVGAFGNMLLQNFNGQDIFQTFGNSSQDAEFYGNVGIGTSPSHLLDLGNSYFDLDGSASLAGGAATIDSGGNIVANDINATTGVFSSGLEVSGSNAYIINQSLVLQNGGDVTTLAPDGSATFATGAATIDSIGNTTLATLAIGRPNVGLGLDVQGAATQLADQNGTAYFRALGGVSAGTWSLSLGDVDFSNDGTMINLSRGLVSLGDVTAFNNAAVMNIDTANNKFTFMNGNVGIGTTTPTSAALTVVGNGSGRIFSAGDPSDLNEQFQVLDNGNVGIGKYTNLRGWSTPLNKVLTIAPDQTQFPDGQGILELAGNIFSGVAGEIDFFNNPGATSSPASIKGFRDGSSGVVGLDFYAGGTQKLRLSGGTPAIGFGAGLALAGTFSPPNYGGTDNNSASLEVISGATDRQSGVFIRRGGDQAAGLDLWQDARSGLTTFGEAAVIDSLADSSDPQVGGFIFRTRTAGTPVTALRILPTGEFGIGTTTPGYKLTVNGDINATAALRFNGNAGTSGNILQSNGSSAPAWVATSSLGLLGSSTISSLSNGFVARWNGSALANSVLRDNGTVAGINATSSSYGFNVQGPAGINPFNVASSSGASLLTVTNAGNVGIGTTTPTGKLHIYRSTVGSSDNSDLLTLDNISDTAFAYAGAGINTNQSTGGDFINFRLNNVNKAQIVYTAGNDKFAINYGSSLAKSVVFDGATGNVGIGTTTPGDALVVVGTSTVSGTLKINTTPFITGKGGSVYIGISAGTGASTTLPGSFFIGNSAGAGASSASNSNFLGDSSGQSATNATSSNFLGYSAGYSATNAARSNFLGLNAGALATGAHDSNFLGSNAGTSASGAYNANFIGNSAGAGATNASSANFIGTNAGNGAYSADDSNFFGTNAGYSATSAYYSNFLGLQAGFSASNAHDANFFGQSAGYGASSASNSNFLGYYAGANASGASASNFLGYNAGVNAYSAYNSNFLGPNAGAGATSAYDSNFFGQQAGYNATSASVSNFFGPNAGLAATNASNSNFFGSSAGYGATYANDSNFFGNGAGYGGLSDDYSNFFGNSAGNSAPNAYYSNFFGSQAGLNATNSNNSNFLGTSAGAYATDASLANFIGSSAGYGATNAAYSNFIGYQAGYTASGADNSNFLGQGAGSGATNADFSNFFGQGAGLGATNAYNANFFGTAAGYTATAANNSNIFGNGAGTNATNARNSNFFGQGAGSSAANANNSIFIGYHAGYSDTVNNSASTKSSILIGDYTSTGGFSDSIAIGKGTKNSAVQQVDIGNVLYATGIYNSSTSSASPISGGKFGVGTSSPIATFAITGSAGNNLFVVASTTGAQLFSILANGNVGIGTSTSAHNLDIYSTLAGYTQEIRNTSSTGGGIQIALSGNTSTGAAYANFLNGAAGTAIGSITKTSGSGVAFNTTSDRRLKENIATTTAGLDDLMKISINDFDFISDPNHSRVQGFIAQNLEQIYPEAVTTNGDDGITPLDLNAQPWQVDYGRITPLIVKSIQDIAGLSESFKNTLMAWFGSATNGITDFYANVFHAKKVETDTLCIGQTCVTEAQLKTLLQNGGQAPIVPLQTGGGDSGAGGTGSGSGNDGDSGDGSGSSGTSTSTDSGSGSVTDSGSGSTDTGAPVGDSGSGSDSGVGADTSGSESAGGSADSSSGGSTSDGSSVGGDSGSSAGSSAGGDTGGGSSGASGGDSGAGSSGGSSGGDAGGTE